VPGGAAPTRQTKARRGGIQRAGTSGIWRINWSRLHSRPRLGAMDTHYRQQALEQHQATAEPPQPSEVARLTPLLHEHLNVLGRYGFTLPEEIAAGQLRPLRNPTCSSALAGICIFNSFTNS